MVTRFRRRLPRARLAVLLLLTACRVQPTTSPPAPPTVVVTSTPVPPRATSTPLPTPTPVPVELVVCQTAEPASLYLYGDEGQSRAAVFDALFDGPIDSVGFAYQPVILEKLPHVEDGSAALVEVEVFPGDLVVDAETGAVVPLSEGVQLAQAGGSRLTFTGAGPARTVQVTAVFNLRPDVYWSDGQILDADDSVFSFEVAASPETPVSKYVVDRTARYEVVDAFATRWTGLPGWVDDHFFLRFWSPLPRHLYGRLTPAQLLADADANDRPLGWGPFTLAAWVKGSHLTLQRNPNYFRAAEGLPRLDIVTFRFGLEPERILAELASGHCDVGLESGTAAGADFSAQVPFLLQARDSGLLAPQFVTATSFEHLDFGIQPAEDYKRAAGRDLFQDVRLRQAIAHCLDRQALVDRLLYGLSEVPTAYVPSNHPYYAGEQLTRYPFDPALGQALLDQAGWVDLNGDGVREQRNRRLSLEYASGPEGSPFRQSLVEFMQLQLLANCGIEVRPVLYAPEALYDPWPDGILFGRKFDLGGFPWRTGIEPPCDLYLTESIPSDQNPGGANNTGYSNPQFDQACRAALAALDEPARRTRHAEAQAIFTRDLPSLPLFFRIKVGVATPRVEGFHVDSTANSDLWNVEQLDLSP